MVEKYIYIEREGERRSVRGKYMNEEKDRRETERQRDRENVRRRDRET